MSEKRLDAKNRWRNVVVAFRMSPEEAQELNVKVSLSGLSKQDYIIQCLLKHEIRVVGGMKVAKHGNRAASSKCGTADCLEALGVNIQQDPDKAREMLKEAGFCFLFAQKYHSAMKYVGPIRKELGIRTVFNILGPLTNPAKPEFLLLGVYDEYLVEPLVKVLDSLGVKRAMVVYGQEKLDEISACGPTTICELRDGYYRTSVIRPEVFGLIAGKKEE